MRRSLGTAVFSGMLGVTLFGIFLTPVFFYIIQGLSENKYLKTLPFGSLLSPFGGASLGLATGCLLAGVNPELFPLPWVPIIGAIAGVLIVRGFRGANIRPLRAAAGLGSRGATAKWSEGRAGAVGHETSGTSGTTTSPAETSNGTSEMGKVQSRNRRRM